MLDLSCVQGTLDKQGIEQYNSSRIRFVYCSALGALLALLYDITQGNTFVDAFIVVGGYATMMLSSNSVLLNPDLAEYAEWFTAVGISALVASYAAVGMWLPGLCIGIVFANFISLVPGMVFGVLNVVAFTGSTQNVDTLVVMMMISLFMNQLCVEAVRAEAVNTEKAGQAEIKNDIEATEKMEDSVKNLRRINKVLLEALRPTRGSAIGGNILEELMERLEFLQKSTPEIAEELKNSKDLLQEFLVLDSERTPEPSPQVTAKKATERGGRKRGGKQNKSISGQREIP